MTPICRTKHQLNVAASEVTLTWQDNSSALPRMLSLTVRSPAETYVAWQDTPRRSSCYVQACYVLAVLGDSTSITPSLMSLQQEEAIDVMQV